MRYWAFMNGEVPGSYTAAELAALPGFSMTTLVCPAQGEIAEKNWRRAGEFSDIARAVTERAQAAPPPASLSSAAAEAVAGSSADVDAMIDGAGTRLFSHVADLMKELESRREEKALILSLQRQIMALKDELTQTRERSNMLEMRLPRIAALEESQRKDQAALESAKTSLQQYEVALNDARITAEKTKNELEATKRRLQETANDLALRNRLVDRMSKELSEKELSLAKSLGLIRRFEEDLERLCPDPAVLAAAAAARASISAPPSARVSPLPVAASDGAQAEPPAQAGPSIPPAPEPLEAAAGATAGQLPPSPTPYTLDEPPPTPPYLEPHAPAVEGQKAQGALVDFIKRIFPGGQSH
jgi:hypothetical protein